VAECCCCCCCCCCPSSDSGSQQLHCCMFCAGLPGAERRTDGRNTQQAKHAAGVRSVCWSRAARVRRGTPGLSQHPGVRVQPRHARRRPACPGAPPPRRARPPTHL
jgi:hypothetical protein